MSRRASSAGEATAAAVEPSVEGGSTTKFGFDFGRLNQHARNALRVAGSQHALTALVFLAGLALGWSTSPAAALALTMHAVSNASRAINSLAVKFINATMGVVLGALPSEIPGETTGEIEDSDLVAPGLALLQQQ